MPEIPEMCEVNCFAVLAEDPCGRCEDWLAYWADVDNTEMDIDWDEYNRIAGELEN